MKKTLAQKMARANEKRAAAVKRYRDKRAAKARAGEIKPIASVSKRGKKLRAIDAEGRKIKKGASCEKCGGNPDHVHHLLPKGGQHCHMRDEPLNLMVLCAVCHDYAHANPADFEAWVNEAHNGRFETLRILSRGDK